MAGHDPRIDAYIARQADFARPILERLRAVVHQACPDVEESLKWSAPSFLHGGSILCGMAAFKQHASFGFWKHALLMGEDTPRDGMGSFGKMHSVDDIPPEKELIALIRRAMRLNDDGARAPAARKPATRKPPPVPPEDFAIALRKNRKAKTTFDAFPPSQQREYVDWITEAKRPETRQKRLLQAVEWLAEGKPRNWKYMNC